MFVFLRYKVILFYFSCYGPECLFFDDLGDGQESESLF